VLDGISAEDMSSAINTTRCDNELELSRHRADAWGTGGKGSKKNRERWENLWEVHGKIWDMMGIYGTHGKHHGN